MAGVRDMLETPLIYNVGEKQKHGAHKVGPNRQKSTVRGFDIIGTNAMERDSDFCIDIVLS